VRPAPRGRGRAPGVDLYWLPLGAGGRFVRLNGRLYEAAAARLAGRAPHDLYHSALEVTVPEGRYVIESAPIKVADGPERGVVGEGPVGARWAGRLRLFRYELRCWRGGRIPDVAEAVESPLCLTEDPEAARGLLDLAPSIPTPVWGRDELLAGEWWNSNSVIAWLLERTGLDPGAIRPPAGGRAPGWRAGIVVARRQVSRLLDNGSGPAPATTGGRRGRPCLCAGTATAAELSAAEAHRPGGFAPPRPRRGPATRSIARHRVR
jgi:hypothetical protein